MQGAPHSHGPGCGCAEPESLQKSDKSLPGSKVFYRDRAMRELHAGVFRAYEYIYRLMLVAVRKYIETHLVEGSLLKAEGPAKLLTPRQLQELRDIVVHYHEVFIAGSVGPDVLPPAVRAKLGSMGLLPGTHLPGGSPQDVSPESMRMIRDAYVYGTTLGAIAKPTDKAKVERQTYRKWKDRPPKPLTDTEKHAIAFASHATADRIRGLGNRVADQFTAQVIEADKGLRRKFEGVIREKVAENIEKRETWRQAWSELGHASGDWSRDMGRIAATEKQDAMIEGQAQEILSRSPGGADEIRVAKQPNPDACPDCLKHYTKGGIPKIFTLAEIQANGSNIGRKRQQWEATLGPLHPWCACELIEVPPGYEFDEEGDLIPSILRRSDFEWDLCKSVSARRRIMTYGDSVRDTGIEVRVADPAVRTAVEEVISRTPPEIFTRATGVTLITTDHGRPQNALDERDYAYWAGNEIRIQQTIDPSKVKRVLEHELGHALNSWILTELGSIGAVRAWHQKLWEISEREGFVTKYAKMEPIENAAEVTRLYMYYPAKLRKFPQQFSFCRRAYKGVLS